MSSSPFLVSRPFDLGWFVLPGLLSALGAIALGVWDPGPRPTGLGLWLVGVVAVDVAHVWASLYRTYLDREARALHRTALMVAPIACLWIGFLLHLQSPLLFWSVLAYVAIFHFIKQHVGFAMLYVRAGGESRFDRRLTELTIWAGTAGPVIWWHAHLPTEFAWFMDGDLVSGLPTAVGAAALWLTVPIWIAFAARRVALARTGHRNPMVVWLALVPALNWYLGIVVFDDDRIFTMTNVFLHGVPYLALVWVAGGRDLVARGVKRVTGRHGVIAVVAVFYGLLLTLAFTEEAAWDRLVWHDRESLFGAGWPLAPGGTLEALVVALLTVPQATHYLLDRWIWKVGPRNPKLATQLGFGPTSRGPDADAKRTSSP